MTAVADHSDYSYAVHDLNIWCQESAAHRSGRVVMSGVTSKLLVALVLAFAASATAGCTVDGTPGGPCSIT